MLNGRICGTCDAPLTGTQQKYCSRSCGAKGTKSWTYVKAERRTWDCVVCGAKHTRQNSPYCSLEHKRVGRIAQITDKLTTGSKLSSGHLKAMLIKYGLKDAKCEWCGITEWRGQPAPLNLDHANGDATDNRLENLRILCANCHSQTDTFCGKNKGRSTRGSR